MSNDPLGESPQAPKPPAAASTPEADDRIPDLPEFPAGGFVLPSTPSVDLAPEARTWVERFLPAPVVPASGDGLGTDHVPSDQALGTRNRLVCTIDDEPAIIARHPTSSRRPRKQRRHPRGRRGLPIGGIAVALAVVSLVGFLIRQRPHGDVRSGGPGSMVQTLGPAAGSGSLVSVPAKGAPVSHGDARPAPAIDALKPGTSARAPSTRAVHPPTPASIPAPAVVIPAPSAPAQRTPTSAAPPAPAPDEAPLAPVAATSDVADSSRPDVAAARYGIEVATFLFEDRAQTERERLAAAGHPAILMTETENGTMSYRVVVGSYISRAAAERAANELLNSGIIQQSRVVRL